MKEYIERGKLIERIEEELSFCEGQDPEKRPVLYGCELGLRGALSYATTLPTADVVERKRGEWLDTREFCGDYMCSNCNALYGTNKFSFCPNCGADMREVEHES